MCIVLKFWFHFALFRTEYPYGLCSIYIYIVVSDTWQQQIIDVIKKKNNTLK